MEQGVPWITKAKRWSLMVSIPTSVRLLLTYWNGRYDMGMYTELVLAAELKTDVPTKVVQSLMYMIGDADIL